MQVTGEAQRRRRGLGVEFDVVKVAQVGDVEHVLNVIWSGVVPQTPAVWPRPNAYDPCAGSALARLWGVREPGRRPVLFARMAMLASRAGGPVKLCDIRKSPREPRVMEPVEAARGTRLYRRRRRYRRRAASFLGRTGAVVVVGAGPGGLVVTESYAGDSEGGSSGREVARRRRPILSSIDRGQVFPRPVRPTSRPAHLDCLAGGAVRHVSSVWFAGIIVRLLCASLAPYFAGYRAVSC